VNVLDDYDYDDDDDNGGDNSKSSLFDLLLTDFGYVTFRGNF
jgi:hypothetical protein